MNVQSGPEPTEPKAPSPAAPRSWALAAGLALLGLGVIAALYVLFAASSKPEAAGYARFAQGPLSRLAVLEDAPPQPATELRDASGAPVTLAAFHGKPTLLNVWATWCAPCIEEMPTLGALKQTYAERGLNVVVVSVDGAGVQDKAKRMLGELSNGALDYYARRPACRSRSSTTRAATRSLVSAAPPIGQAPKPTR
jgi:thiol-disulfide isomerase/thioredoxin